MQAEQDGCKAVLAVVVEVAVLDHWAVLDHRVQVVTEVLAQHLQYRVLLPHMQVVVVVALSRLQQAVAEQVVAEQVVITAT
jgi:hypothetical protein